MLRHLASRIENDMRFSYEYPDLTVDDVSRADLSWRLHWVSPQCSRLQVPCNVHHTSFDCRGIFASLSRSTASFLSESTYRHQRLIKLANSEYRSVNRPAFGETEIPGEFRRSLTKQHSRIFIKAP